MADNTEVVETVTVEATRLMDWSKFALSVVIFLAVLRLL
jgi:hypothetical protein